MKILECFDRENGDRAKAMKLLNDNVRASEFSKDIKPMCAPSFQPNEELFEKLKINIQHWNKFYPTSIEGKFRYLESLID